MMTFASELKTLLSKTEVKNSAIADAVQYDGSYISKWLSGRIIPSERYIDRIVAQIAHCVVSGSGDNSLAVLCEEYGAEAEQLEGAIAARLLDAYRGETRSVKEAAFLPHSSLLPLIKSLTWNGKAVVVADLFSMEHESRLLLAGIRHGRFVERQLPAVKLVVDMERMADTVYDPIFLVHMLTACSSSNISLFHHPFAADKLIYADEERFLTAMLTDEGHCLGVTAQENGEAAAQLRTALNSYCTQENMLVQRIDDLMDNHLYMQSMLSSQHRWITGHFTEQLIPPNLFSQFLEDCDGEKRQRLSQIGALLRGCKPRLLLYRSAFAKLMITGELDFFNKKRILTPREQIACIDYVEELAEQGCVRIIESGFSTDFQYVTDPCVFLSDSIAYIRLENGRYADDLFNITDRRLKNKYSEFFEEAWAQNPMVTSDQEQVRQIIAACRIQMQAMG